jgi:ADP-dependent NAD(P)H-hydrate dehydratase / NAD(P)H-hydrate epimerase
MQKLVTVGQMKAIEKEADKNGLSYELMMAQAGFGLAEVIHSLSEPGQVVGLVGSGNNGGDTLVALAILAEEGWSATAYIVGRRSSADPLVKEIKEIGGSVILAKEDKGREVLDGWQDSSTIMIDGVLGTGAKLPLKPDLADLLLHINEWKIHPYVVAVDCPSGIDCETGEAASECIPADITVCMAAVKTGLMKFPAFELVGSIVVADIGLPEDQENWKSIMTHVVTGDDLPAILPERPIDSHKGSFGTTMVIAGSINYTGAAYLAGKAAYRAGTGLVKMAVPGPLHGALAGQLPEATWLILPHEMGVISEDAWDVVAANMGKVSGILIGPGWGLEDTTERFLKKIVSGKGGRELKGSIGFVRSSNEKPEINTLPPMVVDADGLNLLARIPNWQKSFDSPLILTPHPGEMSVLTGLSVEEIQQNRMKIAKTYAVDWGHVVVLKGALTVIAGPDGTVGVVPVATDALAKAGTGDVLAGLIVGLLSQGINAYDAAITAAWIHAQAGLMAAEWLGNNASVMASDVLDAVPDVISDK